MALIPLALEVSRTTPGPAAKTPAVTSDYERPRLHSVICYNQIVTDRTLRTELCPRVHKIHALPSTEFGGKASGLICREAHPRLPPSVEPVPYIGRRQGLLVQLQPVVGCDAAGPGFSPELVTIALGSVSGTCAVVWGRVGGGLKKALAAAIDALRRHIDGQSPTFVARGP